VTDGQIIDRNSAWISGRLVHHGIEITEHRAVPDDRGAIRLALEDLVQTNDLLFVTGGLGPTSDDFTREVLAETFHKPLKYDAAAWTHIETRFQARGARPSPIQKQQCYFPEDSEILTNSAGTAHAFKIKVAAVQVFALPGPPREIEVVWRDHIESVVADLVPLAHREQLILFRTIGIGEGLIAEQVEDLIRGQDLRVGYRAHVPYVEVKLWVNNSKAKELAPVLAAVEKALKPHLANRNHEDAVDGLKAALKRGLQIRILDRATHGLLQSRIQESLDRDGLFEEMTKAGGAISIATEWNGTPAAQGNVKPTSQEIAVTISTHPDRKKWQMTTENAQGQRTELELLPTALYNTSHERGRRFLTEKVLFALSDVLSRSLKH
jgi:molybdenum cofactor synthesis domain-containing protein